jgi:TnpA family transposase
MTYNDSHRLSILSVEEIQNLYDLPQFTDEERHLYFDLSAPERAAVDAHSISVATHLILQFGYFKAKRQFFNYEDGAVLEDLRYVLERYFPEKNIDSIREPSRPTRLIQQQITLKIFNYRLCEISVKDELERKVQRIAMLSMQPFYILRETLQYLNNERIVAPAYTFLQDMIGRVMTYERNRITGLLGQMLTPEVEVQLDALLQANEQVYRINVLKREPKDFSYNELRREAERRKFFQPLHEFAKKFLVIAGISNESGKYYASLVKFYTVYKLQRMALPTTRLYLLCFAYHRFCQINDNLIEAFIHLVDQYEKQAKHAATDAMNNSIIEADENLKAASKILDLFVDDSIPIDASFATVKEKAFALLKPEDFPIVSDYMCKTVFDKVGFEWNYYTKLSSIFKRNLRQLFSDLDFTGRVEDMPLLKSVNFMQSLFREGKSPSQTNEVHFPAEIIPEKLHRYLFTKVDVKKRFLEVDRYEFLIYRLLRNALESGDIFVNDSTEFRQFEDDLITDTRWQDKATVLREIGAPVLLAPIKETLKSLRETLDARFKAVNQHINEGVNEHIKIRGIAEKRRWTLIYPNQETPVNSLFYSQLPGINIADLLWFVAEDTGFLDAFNHILDRYVKHEVDHSEILACVVAMGTNMGLWKMAEVSDLNHASLMTITRNYFRLETVRAANNMITNATAKLSAFNLYNIHDTLHSSSDGQRMETQIDTINARYSPKYFAMQKGVSAYTLVLNHVPINAKIIGTHEHESHYVFDILYNNTSDIKPDIHSTDTHGTNQVNFWILHTFGYRFAPRYRDLHKRMDTLVSFTQANEYADYLIKPSHKVNEELIEKEWPNIQRIMASLAQKDVTQATIVRKLSSYTRQNQTKKALWELENVFRTLYILEFIDDVELRQCVQKALNRGEAYHRLRRAVAFVNGGKFRVKTEAEQQLWNECSRLITNAIIYYNTVLLSRVYEQKLATNDQEAQSIIKGISPVAWQNVHLFGSFEFNSSSSKVDINALVDRYTDPIYWNMAMQDACETSVC